MTRYSLVTADPRQKHAGVGIFLAPWLHRSASISVCTWHPGRLLHVKCELPKLCLDVVGFYQQVAQHKAGSSSVAVRHSLWGKLSKLLQGLPKRNLLALGADANSAFESIAGLVGRGVLQQEGRKVDPEFMHILHEQDIVVLNTWGRAAKPFSHTFKNGAGRTQIDFILTRRVAADQLARAARPMNLDLLPWRQGPKHRPVVGSLPFVAGWVRAKLSRLPLGLLKSPSRPCVKPSAARTPV